MAAAHPVREIRQPQGKYGHIEPCGRLCRMHPQFHKRIVIHPQDIKDFRFPDAENKLLTQSLFQTPNVKMAGYLAIPGGIDFNIRIHQIERNTADRNLPDRHVNRWIKKGNPDNQLIAGKKTQATRIKGKGMMEGVFRGEQDDGFPA